MSDVTAGAAAVNKCMKLTGMARVPEHYRAKSRFGHEILVKRNTWLKSFVDYVVLPTS